MKAVLIENFGDVKQLHMGVISTPKPNENEILIEIHYTSVNPVDWKIREGLFKGRLPHEFPIIPGWDAAGVVTAVGKNVTKFNIGDRVFAYCRKPTIQWGTYAEFVTVNADHAALMPKDINFSQAAAIPLVSLTAWQALFDYAKLKHGESILIHAGAGGVGGFAISFAKNAGAKVYTTASEENHSYVKKLGAHVAIDYHKQNFAEVIKKLEPRGLDVVFDTIGGETINKSIELLKPNSRLVSIVTPRPEKELIEPKNIQFNYVFVSPNGAELDEIASLIEQGKVFIPHIEEMNLSDAAKAQERSRDGHIKGKIVLKVKE